ncbi:MAG: DinB family protein [Gemmatimonadales bacterium]|nr:DinB family protein [Gemmatimonadales bacterium]
MTNSLVPSGRPLAGEFAEYAEADIGAVEGNDAVAALERQGNEIVELLRPLTDAEVAGLRYASGKWTLKEVLGHLCDDERIYAYRALCVARGDARPLAGFDEQLYVKSADFEDRSLESLLAEYRSVRAASVSLFSGLSKESWLRTAQVNGYPASVRGLAFHIAGHELRHLRTMRDKYLGSAL